MKSKSTYKDNMNKAYALIYGYCSSTMQQKIKILPDFQNKIQSNPLELLKTIKSKMHDLESTRYHYASAVEAFSRIINMKQQEKESLLD